MYELILDQRLFEMTIANTKLPSNQKFGSFFTIIFFAIACYCWFSLAINLAFVFLFIASSFLIISLLKPNLLFPLNKLWMQIGILLSVIINPIVLGIIYFLLFTPTAIAMRFLNRDELSLSFREKDSYWIKRDLSNHHDSFKNQF